MTTTVVSDARRFVQQAKLPARRPRAAARPQDGTPDDGTMVGAILDAGKDQAAVVGSDVVAFVTGVTAERREAIINSALLAQLVATTKVPDRSRLEDWYAAYFEVLANIGWVIQETNFAEYQEGAKNFEAHEAILRVATALLTPGTTALALVTTTIESLKAMNEKSPWITIFNRESRTAQTARFQITLAEQEPNGQFLVSVMAFRLNAKSKITQVLFFKVKEGEATLRHYSGKVTITTRVLDDVRAPLQAKLAAHAGDFVRTLPELKLAP